MTPPTPEVLALLAAARAAEKEQALFYRGLAARAEAVEDAELAERLNGLLADEQHHLSRLTVRLVEYEQRLADLNGIAADVPELATWEAVARGREHSEVARYETLLNRALDEKTRAMILEFLEAERRHAEELGGKWMGA